MMRILSSAVILAVALCVGCGEKSKAATTKPPAQGGGAAAAPAPAPAPAARAGGAAAPAGARAGGGAPAAAAGRQGGAAGAPLTIEQHSATMKQIAASNASIQKLIKSNDLMGAATEAQNLATLFATVERFYTQRNKPDAVKIAQAARTGANDVAAAAKAGDQMKAQTAAGTVAPTCKQCHSMYREGGTAGEPYKFNAASGITPP
jgi:cytochrome c556